MKITSPTTRTWTWVTRLSILSLGLLIGATTPAKAHELAAAADQNSVLTASERSLVRILVAGQPENADGQCFVLTHGCGGTVSGDRFCQLAVAIYKRFPHALVLRLDWSEKASAKIGIFPNPRESARSIDEVGDQAALLLKKLEVDPARTTFIGESFGNWVNARIAHQLGGVQGILAMNPAHEAGGYAPPDLRKHAKRSWSFHTYSIFDTMFEIAGSDFLLETPAGASHLKQHISGIDWLAARIEAGDHSWLTMDKPLPQRRAGHFLAVATMDGQLLEQQLPRNRPVPAETSDRPADPVAMDMLLAAP